MTYVPLGVRTEYSFLDGMCRIEPLVERARALQLEAIGIGDLHSAFALLKFYVAARSVGLQPVLGVRVRLQPDSAAAPPWGDTPPEMLLLATDARGFRNLLQITSLAHLENGPNEPGVTIADLDGRRAGILVLDGGLEGPVCRTLMQGRPQEAERVAAGLREVFGPERFFIQVQRHGSCREAEIEPFMLRLANALNIPVVAANETRYLEPEQDSAYAILRSVAAGRTLVEPAGLPTGHRQHLRSAVEMQRLFGDLPEALANTRLVAERCRVELDLGVHRLPAYRTESGRPPDDELRLLCERGACRRHATTRYQDVPVTVRDRIAHELAVIEEKKLASCFLLVQDVARYAKGEGIPVGPGRGKVAGSLVAYALGITEIDPLQHGLLFEPFLSRERWALPELDLDVGHRGRERLVQYLRHRYGRDRVARLSTVTCFGMRQAVRAVGRVLGCEPDDIESLARMLGPGAVDTLQDALEQSLRLRTVYRESARTRDLLDAAGRLAGQVHHAAPSAAGLMLAPGPLNGYMALERSATGEIAAQATPADAEALGLMQFHLHGLRYLSAQHDAEQLVQQRTGKKLEVGRLGLDDETTYRMLAQGTTACVFQLERPRMQALLRDLQPSRFEDIVSALVLNRPGMRGIGILDEFLARRRGRGSASPGHPELREILGETHGLVLHQEQLMQVAVRAAGFDLEAAETLRSAVGRRSWHELSRHRARFLSGAVERGMELEPAGRLFDLLVSMGSVAGIRSHTIAYGLLAYGSAYLAAHHPVEYTLALLNNSLGEGERVDRILAEAIDRNIRILDVDINRSGLRCHLEAGAIRLGLGQVRGLGEADAESILEERRARGPYASLEEFSSRLPELPRRGLLGLLRAGALETLGVPRSAAGEDTGRRGSPRAAGSSSQLELDLEVEVRGASSKGRWEGDKSREGSATGGGRAVPPGRTVRTKVSEPARGHDLEAIPALEGGRPAAAGRRAARRSSRRRRRGGRGAGVRPLLWRAGQIRSRH